MLFFTDESFQTVNGVPVGALGSVAIPPDRYNHFCGAMHAIKRDAYGTLELTEHEVKGTDTFSRSLFKLAAKGDVEVRAHTVAGKLIDLLDEVGGLVFARWTDEPGLLSLRNTSVHELTVPYVSLIRDFCRAISTRPAYERGAIFLDQLGHTEDNHAACTIANHFARTHDKYALQAMLLQVPHYTHSVVSPGLQMADLVAFLAAQQTDPTARPELQPWWERFNRLATFEYRERSGARAKTCTAAEPVPEKARRLRVWQERGETGGPKA